MLTGFIEEILENGVPEVSDTALPHAPESDFEDGFPTLDLPAGDVAPQLSAILEALAGLPGVLGEPAPAVELRGVAGGRHRYAAAFWSLSPAETATAALGALRARLPEAEARTE